MKHRILSLLITISAWNTQANAQDLRTSQGDSLRISAGEEEWREDEFVGACVAKHPATFNVFTPDTTVAVIEVSKWSALTKCVSWAAKKGKNVCQCSPTCSGLDIDIFSWSDYQEEAKKLLPGASSELVQEAITSCLD